MTLVQRYIKVRGVRLTVMAAETHIGVHTLYKTAAMYKHRANLKARRAIAEYLDLPYEYLWGKTSKRHLKRLIREEIERQVDEAAKSKAKALGRYLEPGEESRAA